jgi:polar amino acid transport system substrate-binding protein
VGFGSQTMRQTLLIATVLVALATLWQSTTYHTKAQDNADNGERLSIATKEIEPFVFVSGEELSGFSIDLWDALALEAGLAFEYEIVTTVQDQLAAIETGSADGAIAAISITEEREAM